MRKTERRSGPCGRLEALDRDKAVRPTIIPPGPRWTLRSQPSLLAAPGAPGLEDFDDGLRDDLSDFLGAAGAGAGAGAGWLGEGGQAQAGWLDELR